MANTLVREVLYRVSDALQDLKPQFTRWTQRSLIAYLNDGQRAIAKYCPPACSRVDAIKLSPGTKQSLAFIPAASVVPGDGSTAADVHGNGLVSVIRNMGSDGLTPGNAIRIVDREVLDIYSPEWHTTTDTKVSGFVFDPRIPKYFYVTPGVPASPAVWVEASFLADPLEVSATPDYGYNGSDTTTISIDPKFVDDLVNYILARAYGKDSESASNKVLADGYTTQFVGSINAQATALLGVNPNLQSLPSNMAASTPRA
ncbi:DUF6682 family protein [Polynucleobacter sp. UK-Kesae-W10]|uniref:phage adaptor protein n=1 Tax=Polynucleobacter sp. UK-Kesae-W10 TaxID=1819738 RepID=UPI001C0E72CF|nr:DUF6682 family protein [Polynucleobacter sp. UK-Kesae-W10]MBU3577578.1 hypothetical protein [Polynucleobacter sp. UK-Kesae-W10]